jgi:hypothetical protein
LLTANNKIVWYAGLGDNPEKPPESNVADFSMSGPTSIHQVILDRNKLIFDQVRLTKDSLERGLIKEDEAKRHIGEFKG